MGNTDLTIVIKVVAATKGKGTTEIKSILNLQQRRKASVERSTVANFGLFMSFYISCIFASIGFAISFAPFENFKKSLSWTYLVVYL